MSVFARRHTSGPEHGGIFFRLFFLMFLVFLLCVLYVVRHPLLRIAGNFWVVDETPANSDAIVVLGDDNYRGDRAARAAEMFKSHWAPRVIASGPYLRPYASIPQLEAHDLANDGVPASAIVVFAHHAQNTKDEALALSSLVAAHGWRRILLVTSNYHTRRSEYIFERTLPTGDSLTVVAAPDFEYDPDNWWNTRQGQKLFFHEAIGMLLTVWELRNRRVQTVGSSWIPHLPSMIVAGLWHRVSLLRLQPRSRVL
jgi:uncharacterized SAM-binding protein YcdF (DUF218 family)